MDTGIRMGLGAGNGTPIEIDVPVITKSTETRNQGALHVIDSGAPYIRQICVYPDSGETPR